VHGVHNSALHHNVSQKNRRTSSFQEIHEFEDLSKVKIDLIPIKIFTSELRRKSQILTVYDIVSIIRPKA
jgi:hypothetical protein